MKSYNEIAENILKRRDKYVAEKKKKRKKIVLTLFPLLCLCITAVIGIKIWRNNSPVQLDDALYPGIHDCFDENGRPAVLSDLPEKISDSDVEVSNEETALVPRWDDLTIDQQYLTVKANETEYSSRCTIIEENMVMDKLCDGTASGFDEYSEMNFTKNVTVFQIKNIANICAVAVKFSEDEKYYVYVNSEYKPENLGDFISDLNLEENISFGTVWYTYRNGQGDDFIYENYEFTGLKSESVWEMLLNDTSLKNVYTLNTMYIETMSISVDIPILGYNNIALWLTDDGHLVTNILNTGKAFYIGPEKTYAFMNHVFECCQGYRIIPGNASEQSIEE